MSTQAILDSLPAIPEGAPSWSRRCMTSEGDVTKYGRRFGGARVHFADGGTAPEVIFTHGSRPGGAEIARCNLADAESVFAGSPVDCPTGIYMSVTGMPRRFEVEVFYA